MRHASGIYGSLHCLISQRFDANGLAGQASGEATSCLYHTMGGQAIDSRQLVLRGRL